MHLPNYLRKISNTITRNINFFIRLNRSACLSKHEMIRKKALWGLANIAGALDKLRDEQVMFSYKKIYDELQTSTDIAGM